MEFSSPLFWFLALPLGLVVGIAVGSSLGVGKSTSMATAIVVGYPLSWAISGLILIWPLHVSYLKGLLVAFMHSVISLIVTGVLGGLVLVVLAFIQLVGA